MPIEPSEAERIICKYLCKERAEALSEELEALLKPVLDAKQQQISMLEIELDSCQDKLNSAVLEAEQLREELEELEKAEEWSNMAKQFWHYCERT